MTWFSIIALAGAMFLLASTPGPGVFATLARALTSGFSHAAVVVAGIVLGDLVFLLLAIYGLAVIADILGNFFAIVRYVGGIYLIWLGYKMWTSKPEQPEIQGINELSWKANFLSGFVITLGNPKVILFYLGFLPTFLNLSSLTYFDVFIAATVVSVVLGSVLLGYAFAAARARHLFKSPRAMKILNRSSGGVMMATGSVLLSRN